MKARTAAVLFLGSALALTAACGGGGDDDDDDDDSSGGFGDSRNNNDDDDDDSGDEALFGSGGGGTLKVDGKSYKVQLKSCILKHEASGNLTGWDGTLEGKKGSTFAGSGVGETVTVAISFDEKSGFLAQADGLDIDGRNVSWKGEGITLPDSKSADIEFDLKCDK